MSNLETAAPARGGYVAGDSHNHVASFTPPEELAREAAARGLRYIEVCQPWLCDPAAAPKPSGLEIAARLAAASDEHIALGFGAERPKTRYGHIWWVNLPPFDDPFGEYPTWHDSAYVRYVRDNPRFSENIEEKCPLPTELPWVTWRRYRRRGALAVAAHPTSWWLNRPEDEQIVTNIAAELPFALSAGEGPDALVAMGYDPDHIFYQNLWFRLLNEGYLLPGVGETDGGLEGKHPIGEIVTWTRLPLGSPFSFAALAEAMRAGRCVMSSGPFVRFTADSGRAETGDRLRADGAPHTLDIEAWSAPISEEALTWVAVFRNGRPHRILDLRDQPRRHVALSIPAREHEFAWYAVKAYGRAGAPDPDMLDVLAYAERGERETDTRYRRCRQVALTNPIWFLPPDWRPPAPVVCDLRLRLVDAQGRPLAGKRVRATDDGRLWMDGVTDTDGCVVGRAPPTVILRVESEGAAPIERNIFLHYPPVNSLLERAYSGRWRRDYPALRPGQVPWSVFALNELRRALERIEWTIAPGTGACSGGPEPAMAASRTSEPRTFRDARHIHF